MFFLFFISAFSCLAWYQYSHCVCPHDGIINVKYIASQKLFIINTWLEKINRCADKQTAVTQELFRILRRKEAGYLEKIKHRKALIDMQPGMPIGYDSTWTSVQNTEPVIICKKADIACTGLQKAHKSIRNMPAPFYWLTTFSGYRAMRKAP